MTEKSRQVFRPTLWMFVFVCFMIASQARAVGNGTVVLTGNACTSSENWKLSNQQLEKNSELADTLTDLPNSTSSAVKKWNFLKKFEKQMNAHPALAGAWGYWYYRAAAGANMLSYAEAGFLDLDKKLAAGSPYSVATKACISFIQQKFKGIDGSSSFVTSEKADQAFFAALDGNDLANVYISYKALYDKAKAAGDLSRLDSFSVLYAQDLYKREKFKEAITAAKSVDKKSDRYADATLVMAWSSFRLKDYAQAVGYSYSLMKSYPQSFEAIEAVWMASASFLEFCLEKEAKTTLEFFKNQVLTLDTWLKKNQPSIAKNPFLFYQSHIQDSTVPYTLKRDWLRSGRLFVLQSHLNSLVDEKAKAKDWKTEKGFYRIAEIDRQLNALTDYYQKEVGVEFQRLIAHENAEIESSVEKGQLLETDILGQMGQSELQGESHKAVAGKNMASAKRVIWTRGGFEKGLNDPKEEVWLDDIGNFVGDFKNACKH